ncbi:Squalene synthase [Acorus gramineus]|uniref:Squalene synthase n=1 Tax=Acorus gramineus TaxID=55184 RepID=A0AAV9ABQ1_ACOGR|nr:Squalene synthase [Acorus gramineus]
MAMMLRHPDEVLPLMKMKVASAMLKKQIPPEEHWSFCYTILQRVSRSFALVIQQLGVELRNAVCIFYLVLRALDTVGGTKDYKVLMDEFHHVSTAFLELGKSYQEAIEDITKRMGSGMAKYICKEVETVDDYDEYCHYVAGLVGLGLSKLFYASGKEELAPEFLSNSMGLFLQKTNIIRDYLEDINEIPKSRMFWPHDIWSKYADKLEDLKDEENSENAVRCLNEMVTDALRHVDDSLKYMSSLRDLAIFRFCAIPQIMAIGTLALCYNNLQVFRGVVKMRRGYVKYVYNCDLPSHHVPVSPKTVLGLVAKISDQTKTMSDVYSDFFEFSCLLKSKINEKDLNATLTQKRIENIQNSCIASGFLKKRSYAGDGNSKYSSTLYNE